MNVACLNEINSPKRKIVTIEDPIEYEMEGITQIHANPKVNLDFATGLRSILRHDPDIIMVGEIRDSETAEIAIRTALTGHLVYSTLHTNDAASGITRLIDMGIEPYLVASSVEAFVAQRLVRVICPNCKEETSSPRLEIKEEILKALKLENIQHIKIYAGRGCDYCHNTGYYGRTAIYEVLVMNEDIRAAILEKPRAEYIRQIAIRHGMNTLRQDGWRKVVQGITTPLEVMNVTEKEEYEEKKVTENQASSQTEKISSIKTDRHQYRIITQDILSTKNEYDSRVYPRVAERVDIRYQIIEAKPLETNVLMTDGVEHSSVTKDISAGGLKFASGYPLPIGTIIELKIHLTKEERSIDCLARIARVEENSLSAMYHIVTYYLNISSADRARIENFVKEKVQAKSQEKKIA